MILECEIYHRGAKIDYQKVVGDTLIDCLIQVGLSGYEATKIDAERHMRTSPELVVYRTTRMGILVTVWALIKEEE